MSNWTKYTDVSGRSIYKIPWNIGAEDSITLEFKYKSIGNNRLSSVFGLDLYNGNDYTTRMAMLIEFGSSAISYYSRSSSYRNKEGASTSISTNSIYKIVLVNGNHAYWYKDDVQFSEYDIERTSTSNLRLDIFNQDTSHLDYLMIQ